MRARLEIHYILLVGLLTAGCASGVRFTAREEMDLRIFDEALREGLVIEKPALNLAVGEKLVYDVSWIGIPVGQIILENHGLEEVNGEEAYHLTFVTISNKFLSNFFKVEDTVHTWISRAGGYSLKFEKQIKEGKYRKHQLVEYDHENLIATYHTKHGVSTMSIPPNAQDVFSILYWVRRQELEIGRQLIFDVNADKKNWVVEVEVEEKGVFDSELMGKVRAFTLTPTANYDGQPLKKGKGWIWLSADRRRIPLAFKVKAKIFGSIVAVLTDAVLPSLGEYNFMVSDKDYDPFFKIYQSGVWLSGLTQTDACLLPVHPTKFR